MRFYSRCALDAPRFYKGLTTQAMLDFTLVRQGQLSVFAFVNQNKIGYDDLRNLTDEMVDRILELLEGCSDTDVTFVPEDSEAEDNFAANPADVTLPWTLGHVIVHTTASAEEAAFLAAELARGVEWHGRSRYEVPWQTVTTIRQCRERLEESRRMRHAMLDVFPAAPHLENIYEPRPGLQYNCLSRFVSGLMHDDSHLQQISKIVAQSRRARAVV
jgi:hypothetical protein